MTATAIASYSSGSFTDRSRVELHGGAAPAADGLSSMASWRDSAAAAFIRASLCWNPTAKTSETAETAESPSASVPASPVQATGGGLRVLLVDDNLLNQVYGEALIEKLGFRVAVASDGASAVHRWKTEQFDLILMDCHMPGLDGFAAARRIREIEIERGTSSHTPIVALTGCTDNDEHEDCMSAGMDAILRKPFNPDELLKFVIDWGTNPRTLSARTSAQYAVTEAQPL